LIHTPGIAIGYGLENIQGESIVSRGVVVRDVLLDQAVYSVGDTALLSFVVENNSTTIQPDLLYRVDVVGNFNEETGEPTTRFFVGETQELPLLLPKKTNDVEIRTILPAYIASSDIGFQVSVFNTKTELLSRSYVRLLVTGTSRPSITYVSQVQVDGEPFSLSAGPTLYKGEQIAFAASFKNTRGSVSLTPTIDIYKGYAPIGEPVYSFAGETIPVGTSRSTEQKIVLPTFEYTPGIYTANITYTNKEGDVSVGPFNATYIVAELRPTLHSSLPTEIEFEKDAAINILTTYTPVPKNIQLDSSYDPASYEGNMETEVSVVDANNILIGTQRVSFLPGKNSVSLSFTVPHYVYGIRVVTTLFEDEKQIDTSDEFFPDKTSLVAETNNNETVTQKRAVWIGGGLVLVLILSLLLKRFLKR